MDALSALRETITRIERRASADIATPAPFGVAAVDRALGGGLARGRLHELFAAEPGPSAAQTRWSIAAAASVALEADAPGLPVLDLALLRQRGRPAGDRWRLEWDRDQICFRQPAPSGAVVPLAPGRSLAGDARRRAG